MFGVKETQCTSCGHRPVCSLSHTFLKVQEQVDKIMVGSEEDNGTTRIVDISWLDIRVNCVHRIPKKRVGIYVR